MGKAHEPQPAGAQPFAEPSQNEIAEAVIYSSSMGKVERFPEGVTSQIELVSKDQMKKSQDGINYE